MVGLCIISRRTCSAHNGGHREAALPVTSNFNCNKAIVISLLFLKKCDLRGFHEPSFAWNSLLGYTYVVESEKDSINKVKVELSGFGRKNAQASEISRRRCATTPLRPSSKHEERPRKENRYMGKKPMAEQSGTSSILLCWR